MPKQRRVYLPHQKLADGCRILCAIDTTSRSDKFDTWTMDANSLMALVKRGLVTHKEIYDACEQFGYLYDGMKKCWIFQLPYWMRVIRRVEIEPHGPRIHPKWFEELPGDYHGGIGRQTSEEKLDTLEVGQGGCPRNQIDDVIFERNESE